MNAFIQTLNDYGESFLSFAWPMLWQSSLLITMVFAFDVLAARRLRAAVRYALWLAVLVKLVLPPALALPTGATWWLWHAKPPLVPVMKSEVVTFDAPAMELPSSAPQTVPFVLPPPELSGAGWGFIAVNSVEAALVFWLVFRWWRVASKVRRAMSVENQSLVPRLEKARPHPGPLLQERENSRQMAGNDERESHFQSPVRELRMVEALAEALELAGLRRCPRLKLVDDVQSPAVYGLFRPVILLPRSLVEKLSARQLRAVLLHEAIHLRRGDVWVNCAQTLLQIAYWWHPLLWLANARIRRLREEAVDDAVMLALRTDADAYAPTLLEVAKYSFRRPLTLALVGILESRSALRRRIERLVDFRPPHKAGLTLLSLCSICVFSAIALPMGQGPAVDETPGSASTVSETTTNAPQYEMREFKVDTSKFFSNLRAALPPPAIAFLFQTNNGLIYAQTDPMPFVRVRSYSMADISVMAKKCFASRGVNLDPPKQVYFNDRLGVLFVYATSADLKEIERDIQELGHENANRMLERGKLAYETGHFNEAEMELHQALVVDPHNPAVQYYSALVSQAITNRLQASKVSIPQDSRVFSEGLGKLYVSTNTKVIGGFTYQTPGPYVPVPKEMRAVLSDPVTDPSDIPSSASININPDNLVRRDFYVGTAALYAAVRAETGEGTFESFRALVAKAGVDLSPPKQLYLTEGMGALCAIATTNDLKIIAGVIDGLHCPPLQIHVKAWFFEVPKKFFANAARTFPASLTNGTVLTNPNFRVLLREIKQQKGIKEIAEPEVTTLVGRQIEMQATSTRPFLTGAESDTSDSTDIMSKVGQIETGPIVYVVPLNTPDGYTLSLGVTASDLKSFDFNDPRDSRYHTVTNSDGQVMKWPSTLHPFPVRGVSTQKTVYDGQTLILFPVPEQVSLDRTDEKSQKIAADYMSKSPPDKDKVLVVLVNATLIDRVGNRLHTDSEMAFAQNKVPPPWPSDYYYHPQSPPPIPYR